MSKKNLTSAKISGGMFYQIQLEILKSKYRSIIRLASSCGLLMHLRVTESSPCYAPKD